MLILLPVRWRTWAYLWMNLLLNFRKFQLQKRLFMSFHQGQLKPEPWLWAMTSISYHIETWNGVHRKTWNGVQLNGRIPGYHLNKIWVCEDRSSAYQRWKIWIKLILCRDIDLKTFWLSVWIAITSILEISASLSVYLGHDNTSDRWCE